MAHSSERLENQPLQPSPAEANRTHDIASQYWSCAAHAALQNLNFGLHPERFELRNMLGRVPPLPDRATYGLLERVPLESKWHITGSVDCQVNGEPAQVPPVYLSWLIEAPTKMTLGGTSFRTWHEFEDDDQPNFLAILVLAWSYILTARLVELQGQDGHQLLGNVDIRTVRWFTAILAPGSGFRVASLQEGGSSYHAPWETSLVACGFTFSIEYGEGDRGLDMNDVTPLTSHEALQSLIAFCNRHSVSLHQLHAGLATALLLPTHNYLGCEPTLPRPEKRNTGVSTTKLGGDDLDQLYSDLPYYITLSCGWDVISSILCGVLWDPRVPGNLASPWLQPLWALNNMKGVQGTPGRYAEVLALVCARRAPNIAFLSIAATISGLAYKIWDQVRTGQPPLERHAYAWTGVPQSFMDVAGDGKYMKLCFREEYIRRSDCWRLRKLPPIVDDDLHYGGGPFTPWEPAGYGLLKNCPVRVQVHKNCERHTFVYEGSTWHFSDGSKLEHDLGRDCITPHVFPDPPPEAEPISDLPPVENDETSFDATVAAFRWVLDNGEGTPREDAYKDPWLQDDDDSDGDEIPVDSSSSIGKESRKYRSKIESYIKTDSWVQEMLTIGRQKDGGILQETSSSGPQVG